MKLWRENNKDKIAAYDCAHKEEKAIRNKAWAAANPEKVKAKAKKHRDSHKEKTSERRKAFYIAHCGEQKLYSREYNKKNSKKIAIRMKRWRDENKEKIAAYMKDYRKANLEKFLQYIHERRSKKLKVIIEKFSSREIFERDGWICQLCRKKINEGLKYPDPLCATLDHIIPLSKNGTHSRVNVQLAHLICNMRKSSSLPEESAMQIKQYVMQSSLQTTNRGRTAPPAEPTSSEPEEFPAV